MAKKENHSKTGGTDRKVRNFIGFINDDPSLMAKDDLENYLQEAGFNREAFKERLNRDMEAAMRRSALVKAKSDRLSLSEAVLSHLEIAKMTIHEKKEEIRRIMEGGGQLVQTFNREFSLNDDDEDLDSLLADLLALEAREKNVDDS